MKTNRKTLIGIALVTVLAAAAGSAVFAHGGGYGYGGMMGGQGMMGGYGGMMGGPGMMGGGGYPHQGAGTPGGPQAMRFADHGAYAAQRLENFKTQLGIGAEQEAAWNGFADAVRAQAETMNARHQAMVNGLSFTEHFAQMQAGAAQMETVAAKAQELYAALTPEQQARADSLTTGGCWR